MIRSVCEQRADSLAARLNLQDAGVCRYEVRGSGIDAHVVCFNAVTGAYLGEVR